MSLFSTIWMVIFGFPVWAQPACEAPPAALKFQGTAFESEPFQLKGTSLRFFDNHPRAISFSYNSRLGQWCYQAARATKSLPARGCLSSVKLGEHKAVKVGGKVISHFILRDREGKAVATVSPAKNILTAGFVDRHGKSTGKRVEFMAVVGSDNPAMEISAWNCPNPRFLSCAGAQIITLFGEEIGEAAAALAEIELSKGLVHYSVSCQGVHEYTKPVRVSDSSRAQPQ